MPAPHMAFSGTDAERALPLQAQERVMAVKYEALKQRKLEELDALLREQADQVRAAAVALFWLSFPCR